MSTKNHICLGIIVVVIIVVALARYTKETERGCHLFRLIPNVHRSALFHIPTRDDEAPTQVSSAAGISLLAVASIARHSRRLVEPSSFAIIRGKADPQSAPPSRGNPGVLAVNYWISSGLLDAAIKLVPDLNIVCHSAAAACLFAGGNS